MREVPKKSVNRFGTPSIATKIMKSVLFFQVGKGRKSAHFLVELMFRKRSRARPRKISVLLSHRDNADEVRPVGDEEQRRHDRLAGRVRGHCRRVLSKIGLFRKKSRYMRGNRQVPKRHGNGQKTSGTRLATGGGRHS